MFSTKPNYTKFYFAEDSANGYITGPPSQTTDALVKWSSTENEVDNTVVFLDPMGNMSELASLNFTTRIDEPEPNNSLWVNDANDHLYFDDVDLIAAATGGVVPPGTQTANTIPTWTGSGNELNDGVVTLDTDGNIGLEATKEVNSVTIRHLGSNPGGLLTMWVDQEGDHLTIGDSKLVKGPSTSVPYSIPHFTTNDGADLDDTQFTLTTADLGRNLILVDANSGITDASPYTNTTLIGNQLDSFVAPGVSNTYTTDNVIVGTTIGRALGKLGSNEGNNILVGVDGFQADGSGNIVIGTHNMADGGKALPVTDNVVIGYEAGNKYSADDGVLIGALAGCLLTGQTCHNNVVIGSKALQQAAVGSSNVVIGYHSAFSNQMTSTFTNNVIIGSEAGPSTTDTEQPVLGANNTIVGRGAGVNLYSGGNNIIIGAQSGSDISVHNGCIHLNSVSNQPAVASYQTVIGNAAQESCYIHGIHGESGDSATALTVLVDSTGKLFTTALPMMSVASEESKTDVSSLKEEVEGLRSEVKTLKAILSSVVKKVTDLGVAMSPSLGTRLK